MGVISDVKIDQKARSILKTFPKDVQDYFSEIAERCKKHGVVFRVSGSQKVNSGSGSCGGYFCDQPSEFAIAINKPLKSVVATLVHEDSHFDQWLEKGSIWHDKANTKKMNSFYFWLMKQETIKDPTDAARHVILLEADCERRSLKKVRKRWSHIISPTDYAQSANAYMFSYLYMAKSRRWISDGIHLGKKCFFRNFPKRFLPDFTELSDSHFDLFKRFDGKNKSGPA